MAKEVILVQPKAGEYETVGLRTPDSLLSIAAIPFQNGWKVRIIDQRTDNDWKMHLKQHLDSAVCVGITSMTGPQIRYALEISKFVKENSNVPVVWGGVHASLLPEQTLSNKYIDIAVKGEGDYTFHELLLALEKQEKNPAKDYIGSVRGIYYKKGGLIEKTPERPLIKDLDKLPDLPYNLIDMKNYYGFTISPGKSVTLMTSRGCPFRCAFCYNTVYYKNMWRGMSAEKTIERIKYVTEKFGVKNIYFQDDNFCANVERFKKIVELILKEKIDIKWGLLGARMDSLKYMDDEFLKKVVKAGCINIDVGIESGSQRILDMISKGTKISDIIEVNKKLAKYFKRIKYTFIMGIPTETEEEMLQSVRFAIKLCKDNPHVLPLFNIFFINPGTAIYDMAIRHGYKEPGSLEEWAETGRGGEYKKYPWLSKKVISMMENFEFTSFFATKNIDYKVNKAFLRFLMMLYRPVARYRFEHNFYHFLIEKKLSGLLTKEAR